MNKLYKKPFGPFRWHLADVFECTHLWSPARLKSIQKKNPEPWINQGSGQPLL